VRQKRNIPLGLYECSGKPPIIVVENGDLGNGYHGPWVKYKLAWEHDSAAKDVLRWTFEELLDTGYGPSKREVKELLNTIRNGSA